MNEADRTYRALLEQTWQKTQDDIDKALLTLSGGALGVSFVFVKDLLGPVAVHRSGFLFSAWLAWSLCAALTLLSLLTSRRAFALKPKIFGVLLDAVSCTLRNEGAVCLERPPRMADFAKWVVAAERALGLEEGEFMRA